MLPPVLRPNAAGVAQSRAVATTASIVPTPRRKALAAAPCTPLARFPAERVRCPITRPTKRWTPGGDLKLRHQPVLCASAAGALKADDPEPDSRPSSRSFASWAASITGAIALVGCIAWLVTGVSPYAALQAGCAAAFSLVFVSEIGDKTFFMAALCAMRVGRALAFTGAAVALTAMTAISVIFGVAFKQVPEAFSTTIPVAEYIGVALLLYFGVRSLRDAWNMPAESSNDEFVEATETVDNASLEKGGQKALRTVFEVASLVFAAEWGDRSMLAIIALAAGGSSALMVGIGALTGHFAATLIAVMGGALIGKYVSEKMIGYIGGVLFLSFAALTFLGVC